MSRKMIFHRGVNASRSKDALIHKMPRLPIMIDNKNVEKEELREFTGQPLHTVLDPEALDGKIVRIFTEKLKAEKHCRQLAANPASNWVPKNMSQKETNVKDSDFRPIPPPPPPDGGYYELFDDVDFGGCSWRFNEWQRRAIGDFTQIWACGFLWWGWKNANDRVSSVDFYTSASTVILCEHPNLMGSWLWLPGVAWVPSLVPYGWNDRASSLHMMNF